MSPVETRGIRCSLANDSACVPFPAPGGPSDEFPELAALELAVAPELGRVRLIQAGFPAGKPRLPLTEPDEKSAETIRQTLARYKIDLRLQ